MNCIKNISFILLFFWVLLIAGCKRNTSTDNSSENIKPENVEITLSDEKDTSGITYDKPFRNQPNEFCTVIRKLSIDYYAPEKSVNNIDDFPKKYCLIDVCVDENNSMGMVLNLGDESNPVTTTFIIVKIFDSYDETKAYADKYKIVDVVYEE